MVDRDNLGKFIKGSNPWKYRKIHLYGADIPNWKGEFASYSAIHHWIKRHLPIPDICQICGDKTKLECANLDHTYKRDIKDWIWICRYCHRRLDKKNFCKWGHELSEENIKYSSNGRFRICLLCREEYNQKKREAYKLNLL